MLTELSAASLTQAIQENLFAFARSFAVLDNAILDDTPDLRRLIVPGVETPFSTAYFMLGWTMPTLTGRLTASSRPTAS